MIATVHHPNAVACYPKMDNSHEPLQEERNANTCLIAAAPELLNACEMAIDAINTEVDCGQSYDGECPLCTAKALMLAAIAKAKGE